MMSFNDLVHGVQYLVSDGKKEVYAVFVGKISFGTDVAQLCFMECQTERFLTPVIGEVSWERVGDETRSREDVVRIRGLAMERRIKFHLSKNPNSTRNSPFFFNLFTPLEKVRSAAKSVMDSLEKGTPFLEQERNFEGSHHAESPSKSRRNILGEIDAKGSNGEEMEGEGMNVLNNLIKQTNLNPSVPQPVFGPKTEKSSFSSPTGLQSSSSTSLSRNVVPVEFGPSLPSDFDRANSGSSKPSGKASGNSLTEDLQTRLVFLEDVNASLGENLKPILVRLQILENRQQAEFGLDESSLVARVRKLEEYQKESQSSLEVETLNALVGRVTNIEDNQANSKIVVTKKEGKQIHDTGKKNEKDIKCLSDKLSKVTDGNADKIEEVGKEVSKVQEVVRKL